MSITDSHTVTLTGLEISSALAAIDHMRDHREGMHALLPIALEQLATAEAALLVALREGTA